MVMGADVLLDELDCFNKESVVVQIVDGSTITTIDLLIVESDEYGATYVVTTYNTFRRFGYVLLPNMYLEELFLKIYALM